MVYVMNVMNDVKRTYYNDGTIKNERYYCNNQLHRTDGPAMIVYYENGTIKCEQWYINNKRHRTNAPAITYYKQDGTIRQQLYYKNGIDITNALLQAHYFEADEYTKELIWSMM